MKIKKKSGSIILIILCCLMSVVVAASATTVIKTSYLEIEDGNSSVTSTVFVPYLERAEVSFEDSNLFGTLFMDNIDAVTRLCVIRNQLETNGQYDPNKKIDIVDYANRYNTINKNSKSIEYKLDDLIKWGNYGFDYQTVTGTKAELDSYFYALKEDMNANIIYSDTFHMDDGFIDVRDYSYADENEEIEEDADAVYGMDVLVSRYKTVNGKDLIDYAENREEYQQLVNYLCSSASQLFMNYSEYQEIKDTYETENSNVIYCYQMVNGGKAVRYSNLGAAANNMSNDELSKLFTSTGRYVCFNPDKLQIATNCNMITAVYMKEMVNNYAYSFEDNSRIWIAVDDSYTANDMFALAAAKYYEADTMFPIACIAGVVSLVLYIFFFVLLTISAGHVQYVDEEGKKHNEIRNCKIDRLPIEVFLGIAFFIAMCVAYMLYTLFGLAVDYLNNNDAFAYGLIVGSVFIANVVLLPIYLIFVRKIKGGLIWKGSILRFICIKIRGIAFDLYDNGAVVTRTWIPYLIFLLVNLILVLLGWGGIIFAFIIDMAIGVYIYFENKTRRRIISDIQKISEGDISHQSDVTGMHGDNLALGNAVNSIGDGIRVAVEKSMKDEKLKADLITNVSHDIKTPLTSIINYVDLIKRENIQDEKIKGYVDILDQKSQRLKALTDDLVEASKISSGAVVYKMERINFVELINQSLGEYSEKFKDKGLDFITKVPEKAVYIKADARGMYRIIENLYNNICKYALENTRVYGDMVEDKGKVSLCIKNISAEPLNITTEELMERFTRGDVSRKTEGSGLGLSIAKNLTEAMGGEFKLELDGDLFKATVVFNTVE